MCSHRRQSWIVSYKPYRMIYLLIAFAVDYANLTVIDLSLAGTPEGRAQLATKLHTAMIEQGFFYVINHGFTQEQVRRLPIFIENY